MKLAANSGQGSCGAGGAGGGGAAPLHAASARASAAVMPRSVSISRPPSVQPPHLEREQCPAGVALGVKLDRPAAHLAILHVRRLVRRQVHAGLEPLTTPGTQ